MLELVLLEFMGRLVAFKFMLLPFVRQFWMLEFMGKLVLLEFVGQLMLLELFFAERSAGDPPEYSASRAERRSNKRSCDANHVSQERRCAPNKTSNAPEYSSKELVPLQFMGFVC
jgi:hypothetical protein